MDENAGISISKGVFVFNNNFKPTSGKWKHKDTSPFGSNLWYDSYKQVWSNIEQQLEDMNHEMFSKVQSGLIEFIRERDEDETQEIATAILLTGINMPDREAQFSALSGQVVSSVSEHVVTLRSEHCQNIKGLIENMIGQFIHKNHKEDLDEDDEEMALKRHQLNMEVLECWYENLAVKTPLVVIIPNFSNFIPKVLEKFILICSLHLKVLPFVFVFGIPTSINILHSSLHHNVILKLRLKIFYSKTSISYLNQVLDKVLLNSACSFFLGGKVFDLFVEMFLFYDLSVNNFIKNFKFSVLEHFSKGNSRSLCTMSKTVLKATIKNLEDLENVRELKSFKAFLDGYEQEEQEKLLQDDEYFKKILRAKVRELQKYLDQFFKSLRCLSTLVRDVPKAPLGQEIKDVYSVAVSEEITDSEPYKKCFQLLNYLSKEELTARLRKLIDADCTADKNGLSEKLKGFLKELDDIDVNNAEEEVLMEVEIEETMEKSQISSNRRQFKEKLLETSKKPKQLNKYEKLRQEILDHIDQFFKDHLVNPMQLPFHEIFFFNDSSVKNHLVGNHRAAIHTALNNPQLYLKCDCCTITHTGTITPTMPDVCVAYKLYLECGKMINLYDWLQAFLAVISPEIDKKNGKVVVDPQLQARFTQAVAELEYLGFIKSSKRKADHVKKLTWGG